MDRARAVAEADGWAGKAGQDSDKNDETVGETEDGQDI